MGGDSAERVRRHRERAKRDEADQAALEARVVESRANALEAPAAGHPTAVSTIVRRLSNSWPEAIRRAAGS